MKTLTIWKLDRKNGRADFFTSKAKALRSAKIHLELMKNVKVETIDIKPIGKRSVHVSGFDGDNNYHSLWVGAELVF